MRSIPKNIKVLILSLALTVSTLSSGFALPVPNAPVASAATSVTTTSFMANWSSVSGVTGYRLDIATDANFSNLLYNNVSYSNSSNSATITTGITAGTNYWYRVRAENSS